MTFTILAPDANASPGLFPPLANTNFQRLYDNINNDHFFSIPSPGAPPNNDGTHRQVTLTNLSATPTDLKGANAIAYTKLISGASQLFFWNGPTEYQLTPQGILTPAISRNLADGAPFPIIFDITYDFVAFGIAYVNGTNLFQSFAMIRTGATTNISTLSSNSTVPAIVLASAGALPATAVVSILNNGGGGPLDIVGALYLIRI